MRCWVASCWLFLCGGGTTISVVSSQVIINEVADKGSSSSSSGVCNNTGADWIELYLPSTSTAAVNLSGYILHDDKGPTDAQAYTFPPDATMMQPGEYRVLCLGDDDTSAPQFGIGGTDQVTLVAPITGAVVSTTGPLSGRGETDVSFAATTNNNATDTASTTTFVYTSTATPGEPNIITLLPDLATVRQEQRAQLIAQNAEGSAFFNMDGSGKELTDGSGFAAVVDFRMVVDPIVWQSMHDERSYQLFRPFESITVSTTEQRTQNGTTTTKVLTSLTSPGRFRPKGQSTLSLGTCLNRTIPYTVDFDTTNSSQTLFGVQRGYLRTHLGDASHVREWTAHRMLARFGLPYLRTRTVRLFVNDDYVGLYSFVEAPEQDYVFQRSFPDYTSDEYGLYKVKTLSLGCGGYTAGVLERAEKLLNSTLKPPYIFERGDHRTKTPVKGNLDWEVCFQQFGEEIGEQIDDVALAYLRADKDCAKMLVAEGIIDRDLGVQAVDSRMETFIANNLADNVCDAGCANSVLPEQVDTTQFLRNIAVMAALLHHDSPVGNGNNYYLAWTGVAGDGWKMVQYDHNSYMSAASADLCNTEQCADDLIHWSIQRPTCGSFETNQIAGPLLSKEEYRQEYLGYVKEFVEEVMTNTEMLDQIANHLLAVADYVKEDPWNDLAPFFDLERAEEDTWWHDLFGFQYVPLLPALKVRSADIMQQLEALESDAVPRDLDDISEGEVCVSWKATDARESPCPDGCLYEGCFRDEFDISHFCDVDTGMCFHGVSDPNCDGVAAGMPYEGIVPLHNEKESFCWNDPGIGAARISECPDYTGESSSLGIFDSAASWVVCIGLFFLLW